MKAEELAYELLHTPFTHESATFLIKAYAQRMIEQDRDRIKKSFLKTMTMGSSQIIDQTPITLD